MKKPYLVIIPTCYNFENIKYGEVEITKAGTPEKAVSNIIARGVNRIYQPNIRRSFIGKAINELKACESKLEKFTHELINDELDSDIAEYLIANEVSKIKKGISNRKSLNLTQEALRKFYQYSY